MSFATGKDVMQIVEQLIIHLWRNLLGVTLRSPFPRMTYYDAMSQYGSDKPDLRLGMEVSTRNQQDNTQSSDNVRFSEPSSYYL